MSFRPLRVAGTVTATQTAMMQHMKQLLASYLLALSSE